MASSSKTKPHRTTRKTSSTHSRNSSTSTHRTEVTINVYDLLPPGRLSTVLWTLGGSLLHSGVVIQGREYAYGGHNRKGLTGVYYTSPKYVPPGGTHRLSILQGFTYLSPSEIERVIKVVSEKFLGPQYNLLTHNCNHFTNALVEALTGRSAPGWLNRAASIGLALPCMVPREWIQPPDVDTAEGALLNEDGDEEDVAVIETAHYKDMDEDEDEDNATDERASMLESERHARLREEQRRHRVEELRVRKEKRKSQRLSGVSTTSKSVAGGGSAASSSAEEEAVSLAGGKRITTVDEPPPRLVKRMDSAGRELPVAERAPLPKTARRASVEDG